VCRCEIDGEAMWLDVSRMSFDDALWKKLAEPMTKAFDAMNALEAGAPANVTEDRMVGHYWLRAPELAPNDAITQQIEDAVARAKQFAVAVHLGQIKPPRGDGFFVLLVIGIGGSALGAQWLCDTLTETDAPMIVRFIDNTDPSGIDRVIEEIGDSLELTMTLVVSKSGSTCETLNGMVEVARAYANAGLDFAKHAVAVTQDGSVLHERATGEGWLATFPMWDWVGGRTSVLAMPGLLPVALVGADVDELLSGAHDADLVTRERAIRENPAATLAAMWYAAGGGRGDRQMVVLPYSDRLALFSRYLQQLVMESLGKGTTRDGARTKQGLTVLGNKGSTDQHALVQQLRDGRDDFFVTFVRVLADRGGVSPRVAADATSGDCLDAFWQGTRDALTENGRDSMTITMRNLDEWSIGALIALFERAVGLYAELIDVNAYDQPGVEAGKQAASAVIELQREVLAHLSQHKGKALTAAEISQGVERPDEAERIHHLLTHAAANPDHGVTASRDGQGGRRFQIAPLPASG